MRINVVGWITALLVPFSFANTCPAAEPRDEIFKRAQAYWKLGDGGAGAAHPLTPAGKVELGVEPQGEGAIATTKVARLTDGYFDAGKELNVKGNQITVYLRARDPRGQWSYGLLSKRGGHDRLNFNLFGIGGILGFELHSDVGLASITFPLSQINAASWHDLVSRYDGKVVELVCDGVVMARRPFRGQLTQNDEPVLIGAETDQGKAVRPFTGEIEEAALWPRALTDDELAMLVRKEKIVRSASIVEPYESPIHYRPEPGILADTIPMFDDKGQYHIYYLLAGAGGTPWAHIVSRDLVHWQELPIALPLGKPDEPDGGNVFTGCAIESNGKFHIYYTGNNVNHPGGIEHVMHATSPDAIHWTKHPEQTFGPDGSHYQAKTDFRDPFVFWNDKEKRWWLLLCTRDAHGGRPVQGVAVSKDLVKWEQVEPLKLDPEPPGTPECPDLFQIGQTYYLIHSPSAGVTEQRFADDLRGAFRLPETPAIDTPVLYAAKRMFDGRRHVLTGWIRDLEGDRDGGGFRWGGTQSVPREVTAGPNGQLRFRPVPEAVDAFTHTVANLADKPKFDTQPAQWTYEGDSLVGESAGGASQTTLDVPDNYLLTAKLRLDPTAIWTLVMREQAGGDGYRLVLRPEAHEAEISGPGFHFPRRVSIDAAQPITIQAFVQGTIIECFINNAYAFSCRAYNYRQGKLGLNVSGGKVSLTELTVKTHMPRPERQASLIRRTSATNIEKLMVLAANGDTDAALDLPDDYFVSIFGRQ